MQNYNTPNIQTPSTNSNNFLLLTRLAAIAVFQNLLFVGLFYALSKIAMSQPNSGGFAGLAFLLTYITGASYIAQFSVVIISGMLLKRFGFSQPFKVAIVAFVLSQLGGLISVFLLDGQKQIVAVSVGFLTSIIYYLAAYLLIKVFKSKYALYIAIPASLAAIGVIIVYAQIPLAERYIKHTNNDKVAKLDFEVYKPSYLPTRFKQGPVYIEDHFKEIMVEYMILNRSSTDEGIKIYQSRHTDIVDKLIVPPEVCFIAIATPPNSDYTIVPDTKSTPCIKKTTPGGVTYYREDKNTQLKKGNIGEHYFYIRKGNTDVFMHFIDAHFKYTDSFEPDLQKIIDSFQVQSTESLSIK